MTDRSDSEHRATILIVDDDPDVGLLVERRLNSAGHDAVICTDGASCLNMLKRSTPSVILLDLGLPDIDGLTLLGRIRQSHRDLPVIMLTAESAVEQVVAAMRGGAYDYLTKPIDHTHLTTTVKNAVERQRLASRVAQLEREADGQTGGMVGRSPVMLALFRQIEKVAGTDVSVLLQGESGTGKELVARALHDQSGRNDRPFVALNCAAIPESLQESELFGHERGAFTGANARRRGKFEQADGGTLFLDEVAELSPALQAKLLRVLQQRTFSRLGGEQEIESDFRLIAATHQPLAQLATEGRFREDLFFRIAVFEIEIPPLRERAQDIPLLAHRFLVDFGGTEGARRIQLSDDSMKMLLDYPWPGNVRELQNTIHRAVIACRDQCIVPADLPGRIHDALDGAPCESDGVDGVAANRVEAAPGKGTDVPIVLSLEEMESAAIEEALRRCEGNVAEVVRQLGIGRSTLYRKLKKYGLR